jgi:hypothetical protein
MNMQRGDFFASTLLFFERGSWKDLGNTPFHLHIYNSEMFCELMITNGKSG